MAGFEPCPPAALPAFIGLRGRSTGSRHKALQQGLEVSTVLETVQVGCEFQFLDSIGIGEVLLRGEEDSANFPPMAQDKNDATYGKHREMWLQGVVFQRSAGVKTDVKPIKGVLAIDRKACSPRQLPS